MFRKTILAVAATAAIGAAALTPTAASAWGWHGGWHGWHGGFFAGPAIRIVTPSYADACTVRRWVETPFGPRVRFVNRCY
jgi:hypothetical protein